MDEKLLLKAVVLAGEIMLSSGAEVSRVENTMQFMLRRSNCEVTEAVVLATGLFVTMADPGRRADDLFQADPCQKHKHQPDLPGQ